MIHNKNTKYTMFHICTTEEKYSVYYNYKESCFYGCYAQEEASSPANSNFSFYYLGIPIALSLCYLANQFFYNCTTAEAILGILFFFICITALCSFSLHALLKKGQIQLNSRLQKLDFINQTELEHYLLLGKSQFPKQLLQIILLGVILCSLMAIFFLSRNVIFLLILTVFYFIEYLLWSAYRPIQKFFFLKRYRKKLST